jgi:serine/threonine protein kinase
MKKIDTEIPNRIGRYEIIKLIGTGSFAQVHLATYGHFKPVPFHNGNSISDKFAIKVCCKSDREASESLRNEAQTLQELTKEEVSPNIVQFIEYLETETLSVLVLEYVPGVELFDYVMKKGTDLKAAEQSEFLTVNQGGPLPHASVIPFISLPVDVSKKIMRDLLLGLT